jgi:hypothetical protein
MAAKAGSTGVVRIDIDSNTPEGRKQTHGWQARVYRGNVTHSKFFSDSKLGGKAKAKKAASDWREQKLSELGPAPARPRADAAVYIYRTEAAGWPIWSVVWRDKEGKQSQTRVSITQNGVKGGRQIADEKAAYVLARLKRGVSAGEALQGFGKKAKAPAKAAAKAVVKAASKAASKVVSKAKAVAKGGKKGQAKKK